MQTAVQKLIDRIKYTNKEAAAIMDLEGWFFEALEMEKEQMELCAVHIAERVISVIDEHSEWKEGGKEFEDYYNQTYNQ